MEDNHQQNYPARRIHLYCEGQDSISASPALSVPTGSNVIRIRMRSRNPASTERDLNGSRNLQNTRTISISGAGDAHIPIKIIHQKEPVAGIPQVTSVTSPISQMCNPFDRNMPHRVPQIRPSLLDTRLSSLMDDKPNLVDTNSKLRRQFFSRPLGASRGGSLDNGMRLLDNDSSTAFRDFERQFDVMTTEAKTYMKKGSLSSDSPTSPPNIFSDVRDIRQPFASFVAKTHQPYKTRLASDSVLSPRPFNSISYSVRSGSDCVPAARNDDRLEKQRVKAKLYLGNVLHKLVSKPNHDDSDSGYSGSGGTQAGFTLSQEEIRTRIKQFNEKHCGDNSTSQTKIQPAPGAEDVFQGIIPVSICIEKTITMKLSSGPKSLFQALQRAPSISSPEHTLETLTVPIQLPKNTSMGLNITSEYKAETVVRQLLNKFNIADDSRGFALFEQTLEGESEVKLRKIASSEKPMLNFLRWSTETVEKKRFVLKEHDEAEVMWEAFSLPELHNFLKILEMEEAANKQKIRELYQAHRITIKNRLEELRPTNVNNTVS